LIDFLIYLQNYKNWVSLKKRNYNGREVKQQQNKMKSKTIEQLNEFYNLNFKIAVQNIKKSKAKLVLLQFPDGLKQYAVSIVDYLMGETKNKTKFLIWFGSCYGACDIPVGLEKIKPKIDLIIQFGHNEKMPEY